MKTLLSNINQNFFSMLRKPFFISLIGILLTNSKIFALNYNAARIVNNLFYTTVKPDTAIREQISAGNAHEIAYQAVLIVQTFESVLNSITFNDNTATELQGYINNSFTPGKRFRIFYSNNVIIEDDLDPKFNLGKTKDLSADKYLNEIDLNYEKTPDASISFSNFVVSDIKRNDYIYVNIKFDETFKSKFKPEGTTYTTRQRIAEVRADRNGKKNWEVYIVGIRYYDPTYPINNTTNAVQIVNSDTLATPTVIKEADIENAMVELVKGHMENTKIEHNQFLDYLSNGDELFKTKQYRHALEFYVKAEVLNPLSPIVNKKIGRTRRLILLKRTIRKTTTRKSRKWPLKVSE